jgi:hypothetical protein
MAVASLARLGWYLAKSGSLMLQRLINGNLKPAMFFYALPALKKTVYLRLVWKVIILFIKIRLLKSKRLSF